MQPFIPEGLIPITLMHPQLGNTASADWINVSEAEMVWLDFYSTIAGATTTQIDPLKAYAAAGTGSTALTVVCPIWAGYAATGAALTLTRQTDAVEYDAALAGNHRVIIQIDPATLGAHATGGDYKYISVTAVGEAADYQAVTLWVKPRYASDSVASTRWIV